MLETNVGVDPELVVGNVAPALEVTQCSLNWRLACEKLPSSDISLHIFIAEQLQNPPAAFTTVFAAMLVAAHQNSSCAKVIPCNLINRFALCSLENYAQAELIIVLGNGIFAKLDKINAFAAQFTGGVAIQLKK